METSPDDNTVQGSCRSRRSAARSCCPPLRLSRILPSRLNVTQFTACMASLSCPSSCRFPRLTSKRYGHRWLTPGIFTLHPGSLGIRYSTEAHYSDSAERHRLATKRGRTSRAAACETFGAWHAVAQVFISYSRKDKEFVQRLADALAAQKREGGWTGETLRRRRSGSRKSSPTSKPRTISFS